jgi:hypothetical protein
MCGSGFRKSVLVAVAVLLFALAASGPAFAQDDPNSGSLTFTGGFDMPSIYYFRGIRQDTDPGFTLWPFGDVGLSLASGDGPVKSATLNVGVWNSLHSGSAGLDGTSGRLHYEEDFYAGLSLGLAGGMTLGTTFTAYTSPNGMFNTVKEISVKAAHADLLAPYGLVAVELEGQADAGANEGIYLELGAGPSVPLGGGRATLAIPTKVGLSLRDYYEGFDEFGVAEDSRFGFFSVGGLLTFPITAMPTRFGAWNVHGGADFLVFGDRTELINMNKDGETSKNRVVGLFGIGVTY